MITTPQIICGDCLHWLREQSDGNAHLSFVDPPFNQGKDYRQHDDLLPAERYWGWMRELLAQLHHVTAPGGAVYFMQREKNTENVLRVLREAGWCFQNLIIWKKKTSAVPVPTKYSKQYQIIAFAAKGEKPRVFHKLRIDPPTPVGYKNGRENGLYLTDVWDDVRELTSGYFAGDEALRDTQGRRLHVQQTPIALLLRIILSSTLPGDMVLDPFAGSGTTLVVAQQLERNSIGIEIDPENTNIIEARLAQKRAADRISKYYDYYRFTPELQTLWRNGKGLLAEQECLLK